MQRNFQKSIATLGYDKSNSLVFVSLAIIILLRILFTGLMGLMPQDAYYFFYSENLALSYFDHPPAVAYMLRFFTVIFGQNAFAIKFADFTITALTILSFYSLSQHFVKKEDLSKPLLLLISTFMVTILSLITTPDVPLLFFWTLSVLSLYKAIILNKKWHWLLAGLCMGLAFDSKYTALLLPFGLTLFLIVSANYRKLLFSVWYWLSALIFLMTISPVVIWNIQNKFASFKFQSSSRAESVQGFDINIKYFFGVIGHQAAILIPVLFFGLLIFLFKAIKKNRLRIKLIQPPTLFLLCFFLPTFFLFFGASFFIWVKLNWLMPAYITGIIWVSRYFSYKWIRMQVIVSVIIHLVLAFQLIFYPYPVQSDDTWYGWKDLSQQVETIHSKHPDAFIFSADGYKTSAILDFYLNEKIYHPNVIGEVALQMDYLPNDIPTLAGKEAIFLDSSPRFSDEERSGIIPDKLLSYFSSVEELAPILIKRNDKTVRKFFVYLCKNYHPEKVLTVN